MMDVPPQAEVNSFGCLVYSAPHSIGGESDDHGIALASECPSSCFSECRECFNGGPNSFFINAMPSVTKERPDMWMVLCQAFDISNDVVQAIEDNSADAKVRCIDVIHFIYHNHHGVTLDVIKERIRGVDSHLASIINSLKPVAKKNS